MPRKVSSTVHSTTHSVSSLRFRKCSIHSILLTSPFGAHPHSVPPIRPLTLRLTSLPTTISTTPIGVIRTARSVLRKSLRLLTPQQSSTGFGHPKKALPSTPVLPSVRSTTQPRHSTGTTLPTRVLTIIATSPATMLTMRLPSTFTPICGNMTKAIVRSSGTSSIRPTTSTASMAAAVVLTTTLQATSLRTVTATSSTLCSTLCLTTVSTTT